MLYHDYPAENPRSSHCDLMLEADGKLRTWALPELPSGFRVARPGAPSDGRGLRSSAANTIPAEQLPDHRLAYLDYEGPVSGDRGTVTRLDSGEYVSQKESPNQWVLEITGRIIHGQVTLRCIVPDASNWQLTFEAASRD